MGCLWDYPWAQYLSIIFKKQVYFPKYKSSYKRCCASLKNWFLPRLYRTLLSLLTNTLIACDVLTSVFDRQSEEKYLKSVISYTQNNRFGHFSHLWPKPRHGSIVFNDSLSVRIIIGTRTLRLKIGEYFWQQRRDAHLCKSSTKIQIYP